MLPQENRAAVTRALHEAFGVTEFEDIHMIKDLAASLVYRIVVRGSPFLLKISNRTNDPERHYTCMKMTAEAGLSPHVWYTTTEDRISITDFVDLAPLPAAEARVRIPATLRALHALPPFPEVPNHINTSCMFLMGEGAAVDGFIQKVQAANILPKADSDEFFARYHQLAACYPHHHPDLVSSHNDLFKPDNILFDGHRVWLVDWEAAFLNDRYADLAVVANMLVTNDAEEGNYLQAYFGAPPDEYQQARFFLAQQVAHMFYAMAFLMLGSSAKPIDWTETIPDFHAFQRRFWSGEVNLEGSHMKTVFGRVHWAQLLQNLRQPRFNEALRIVSDRHATANLNI